MVETVMIDFNLIVKSLPALWRGTLLTLKISFFGCAIGLILGTILGIAQTSKLPIINYFINFFITIIRGTPMLIQIFIVRYVFPQFGIVLPLVWAAILAIGINSSAYVRQIIRSGILSVSKGQIEAAQTLGLSRWQIMRQIVLPQAFQTVFPVLGNELITLVKDSSLASAIGVAELTQEASHIRSVTYDALTTYLAVAVIYLILTSLLSLVFNRIEKRISRHVTN